MGEVVVDAGEESVIRSYVMAGVEAGARRGELEEERGGSIPINMPILNKLCIYLRSQIRVRSRSSSGRPRNHHARRRLVRRRL